MSRCAKDEDMFGFDNKGVYALEAQRIRAGYWSSLTNWSTGEGRVAEEFRGEHLGNYSKSQVKDSYSLY